MVIFLGGIEQQEALFVFGRYQVRFRGTPKPGQRRCLRTFGLLHASTLLAQRIPPVGDLVATSSGWKHGGSRQSEQRRRGHVSFSAFRVVLILPRAPYLPRA